MDFFMEIFPKKEKQFMQFCGKMKIDDLCCFERGMVDEDLLCV